MTENPVVIIGAGPAGLAAARELARNGRPPLVLEQSPGVGGIARTESYHGYHFDIGGHRFFTKDRQIEQLWQELLGEELLEVVRLSRIYYRGRFFRYPLELRSTLRNLGPVECLLILGSYVRAQCRFRPGVEETFEQWVTNRFGRRLYQTFFKTYTEKVWGIPCRKIRADWAAQRIKGLSLATAVAKALFGTGGARSLIERFQYPRFGPGMMWQRFAEAVQANGGEVRLDSQVTAVRHQEGRVTGVVCRCGGGEREIPVAQVITGTPLPVLIEMLEPAAPAPVRDAARCLCFRDFLIVILIVDRPQLFPDQWIYVHSPEVRVGRIQNFKNWSASMVPDPGRTSIGMEYFCDRREALWSSSDRDLAAMAASELAVLGLAGAGEVIDSYVVRQPAAYPVYDEGYERHLAVLREYLDGFENLQTIGRNGMHRYNNMDHSMRSGILAAENVLGADHDLWSINEEQNYLEEERPSVSARLLAATFARIDKLAFAVAVGSVAGVLVFSATLWIILTHPDAPNSHLRLLAQYFIGYTVTVQGAFIALAYSFFWGFLFGWLFAYLRNLLLAVYLYRAKRKLEMMTLRDFFDNF